MDRELTIPEASARYNVPVQTIHRARKAGHIKVDKLGEGRHATYFLDPDSFAAWLKTYRPRSQQPVSG